MFPKALFPSFCGLPKEKLPEELLPEELETCPKDVGLFAGRPLPAKTLLPTRWKQFVSRRVPSLPNEDSLEAPEVVPKVKPLEDAMPFAPPGVLGC